MNIGTSLKNKRNNIFSNIETLLNIKKDVEVFFVNKYESTKGFFRRRAIKKAFREFDFNRLETLSNLVNQGTMNDKKSVRRIEKEIKTVFKLLSSLEIENENVKAVLSEMLLVLFFELNSKYEVIKTIETSSTTPEELCIFIE